MIYENGKIYEGEKYMKDFGKNDILKENLFIQTKL